MSLNTTWTAYDYPNMTGGFANVTSYVNTTTSGTFGIGMLLAFYMVLFLSFRKWGDLEGFTAATFITTVMAGIFRGVGLVTDLPFLIGIMLTGLCIILLSTRK